MRRILRKIAAGEEDSIGDVTTLADPTVSVVAVVGVVEWLVVIGCLLCRLWDVW